MTDQELLEKLAKLKRQEAVCDAHIAYCQREIEKAKAELWRLSENILRRQKIV